MDYYSAIKRNECGSVELRWIPLEPVIQSEVSQKEENKYCISTRVYGVWKDSTDEPICRTTVETQT